MAWCCVAAASFVWSKVRPCSSSTMRSICEFLVRLIRVVVAAEPLELRAECIVKGFDERGPC